MKILTPYSWLQLSQSFKTHHVKLPQPEGPCQLLHTKALGHYGGVPGLYALNVLPWAQHLTPSLRLTPGNALSYLSHAQLILYCPATSNTTRYHCVKGTWRTIIPLSSILIVYAQVTLAVETRPSAMCLSPADTEKNNQKNKPKGLGIHRLPRPSWKQ